MEVTATATALILPCRNIELNAGERVQVAVEMTKNILKAEHKQVQINEMPMELISAERKQSRYCLSASCKMCEACEEKGHLDRERIERGKAKSIVRKERQFYLGAYVHISLCEDQSWFYWKV